MDNLSVNDNRFEVAELVLEFAFLVFASKEVDSLHDSVRLEIKAS